MDNFNRYLCNNHIDMIQELATGKLPDSLCLLYINPFNYYWFKANPLLLDGTNYRIDGLYAITLFKLLVLKNQKIKRQSFDMTSLAPLIFQYCQRHQLSLFIAGGLPGEAEIFAEKIKGMFENINIIGVISGYLPEEDIIDRVKQSKCDVAILGLGNTKQEIVATRLFSERPSKYFTCGAFISQTANSRDVFYYPKIIDTLNMRWLYRIFSERHILKRILKFYPKFGITLLKDSLLKNN